MDVRQDLGNAYILYLEQVLYILKVKQSSKRAYTTPISKIIMSITHNLLAIRIPMSKMQKKIMEVDQDVGYTIGCPSRLVLPIFKVKRALNRAYLPFRWFSSAIAHKF